MVCARDIIPQAPLNFCRILSQEKRLSVLVEGFPPLVDVPHTRFTLQQREGESLQFLAFGQEGGNVITGLIKTNFPTRIAFRVVSRIDSSTILDTSGAENLIGRGDMLYYAGVDMERVQCALVEMKEINRITSFIEKQTGYKQCYNTPYYLPVPVSQDGESGGGMIDMQNLDPLFEDAARLVVQTQKGSTSDLQRKMGMGYARAGRVMDQLESAGIVGPQEGSKPRQVLVADLIELEEVMAPFLQQ